MFSMCPVLLEEKRYFFILFESNLNLIAFGFYAPLKKEIAKII